MWVRLSWDQTINYLFSVISFTPRQIKKNKPPVWLLALTSHRLKINSWTYLRTLRNSTIKTQTRSSLLTRWDDPSVKIRKVRSRVIVGVVRLRSLNQNDRKPNVAALYSQAKTCRFIKEQKMYNILSRTTTYIHTSITEALLFPPLHCLVSTTYIMHTLVSGGHHQKNDHYRAKSCYNH